MARAERPDCDTQPGKIKYLRLSVFSLHRILLPLGYCIVQVHFSSRPLGLCVAFASMPRSSRIRSSLRIDPTAQNASILERVIEAGSGLFRGLVCGGGV